MFDKIVKVNNQEGIAHILLIVMMLFLVVALPITTSLVKKNQENRSKATGDVCIPSVTCHSNGRTLEILNSNCSMINTYDCPYGCNLEAKACNTTPMPCSDLGARRCSVNYVQFCTASGWVDTIRCGGGAKTWGSFSGSCNSATNACDPSPKACVVGETLCQGAKAKHYVCNIAENGWSNPIDCPTGECNKEYTDCAIAESSTSIPTVSITNSTSTTSTSNDSGNFQFEIAFAGLKPDALCWNKFANNVKVSFKNRLTGSGAEISTNFALQYKRVNSNGDQLFLVNYTGDTVPSGFMNITGTDNVLKVKGYKHAQMKYCTDNQKTKVNSDSPCDIGLVYGKFWHFGDYPILAGDIDANGAIDLVDFSTIKASLAPNVEPDCSRVADLNGDGVVNNLDIGLIKIALSYKYDE